MRRIDWSKAPEGTTGAVVANFDGGSVRKGDIRFIPGYGLPRENYHEAEDAWTYHEAPALPKWTGAGLPPVGTVCEMRDSDAGTWEAGEVRYISHLIVVMRYKGQKGNIEEASEAKFAQFRPLRTPEQIAADEREREIESLATDIMSEQHVSGRVIAERLHALGYRKVEGGAA